MSKVSPYKSKAMLISDLVMGETLSGLLPPNSSDIKRIQAAIDESVLLLEQNNMEDAGVLVITTVSLVFELLAQNKVSTDQIMAAQLKAGKRSMEMLREQKLLNTPEDLQALLVEAKELSEAELKAAGITATSKLSTTPLEENYYEQGLMVMKQPAGLQ